MTPPRLALASLALLLGCQSNEVKETLGGPDSAVDTAVASDADAQETHAMPDDGADVVGGGVSHETKDGSAHDASTLVPLQIPVPDGFEVNLAGIGVTLYRKDYDPGQPDWVAVVDMRVARLKSVFGGFVDAPMGRIERRAPVQHWDDAVTAGPSGAGRARLLVSGTYFAGFDPAAIAFGLKRDGVVISYGYGAHEYPGQTQTIAWDSALASAQIAEYDMQAPDFGTFDAYPDVVGGLAVGAHPAAASYLPKVALGVGDFDGDDKAETVFIMSSLFTREQDMEDVLTAFGATGVLIWTGSTTAFMVVDGREVVPGANPVPHALAVFEGPVGHSACGGPCASAGCDPSSGACDCSAGYGGEACATCVACEPSEVIVDDADAGFVTFGRGRWLTHAGAESGAAGAWGGGFHYLEATPWDHEVWAGAWSTPTPLRGVYTVEVFVPDLSLIVPAPPAEGWLPCTEVRYRVLHDGAPLGEMVVRDHLAPGWLSLGDFSYSERHGAVRLRSSALPISCGVQFDAVRFTRKGD